MVPLRMSCRTGYRGHLALTGSLGRSRSSADCPWINLKGPAVRVDAVYGLGG